MQVIDTAFWDFGTAIRLAHLPIFRFQDWDMGLHHHLVGGAFGYDPLHSSTSRDSLGS